MLNLGSVVATAAGFGSVITSAYVLRSVVTYDLGRVVASGLMSVVALAGLRGVVASFAVLNMSFRLLRAATRGICSSCRAVP